MFFKKAKEIYGGLEPSTTIPPRQRTISPPLSGRSTVVYHDPSVRQAEVTRIYRVPSARQNAADSLALEVAEEILSGGPSSRLYQALVVGRKLATSVDLSYSGNAWDDGQVTLSGTPVPGVAPEALEQAMVGEVEKLAQEPVGADELKDAIQRMQDKAVYARDSLTGPAMVIGYGLVTGQSLDDIENWPERIASVTAEQIQDVARRYLDPSSDKTRYVSGYLLPEEPKTEDATEGKPAQPKSAEEAPHE